MSIYCDTPERVGQTTTAGVVTSHPNDYRHGSHFGSNDYRHGSHLVLSSLLLLFSRCAQPPNHSTSPTHPREVDPR